MHASKSIQLARYFCLAALALTLVLTVPVAWFPVQLGKAAAFAILLAIALIFFVCGGGMQKFVRLSGAWWAFAVVLLPLAYLASWFFSVDRTVALTGYGLEWDTVFFVILGALAFMTAFALFREMRPASLFVRVLVVALAAAALFQCVTIVFGTAAIPFQTFADRSVNVVGKWNDLGILVSLLSFYLLAVLELLPTLVWQRLALYALLAVFVVLLGVIHFPLAWGLVAVFSAALAVVAYVSGRPAQAGARSGIPWHALGGAAVSVVFLLLGSSLNAVVSQAFPVSSLEVRPSYQTTLNVTAAAHQDSTLRLLLGTGPNTFMEEWLLHRPVEVNQSVFWNLDFNVGFSTLLSVFESAGLFGSLAWLLPALLVLAALARAARLGDYDRRERTLAVMLGFGSLFLWAAAALYVPSQNVLFLAFAVSGAAFGFLCQLGRPAVAESSGQPRSAKVFFGILSLVVVLLALWTGVASARRLASVSFVNGAMANLQSGDVAGADALAARGARVEENGDVARALMQLYFAQAGQAASDSSIPAAQAKQKFAAAMQQALAAGAVAVGQHPQDYRPYFFLGQIYESLASLNVDGAAALGSQAYLAAARYNPTNPAIALGLARVANAQKDAAATKKYSTQALTLKPDYTDAILFVVSLDVANNDLSGAIAAALQAVQSAPGVASIWFELGVLYYSQGDMSNAAVALERALALAPDYANAKYYLGLAYYKLARTADAVKQFEDLARGNPDNKDIQAILANLKAGKAPLGAAHAAPTTGTAPLPQ